MIIHYYFISLVYYRFALILNNNERILQAKNRQLYNSK